MENIMNLILAYSPAITACISVVVALIVGIKKIKKAGNDTLNNVKESNEQIIKDNAELRRENASLKRELAKVMAHIKHIRFIEDKEE